MDVTVEVSGSTLLLRHRGPHRVESGKESGTVPTPLWLETGSEDRNLMSRDLGVALE